MSDFLDHYTIYPLLFNEINNTRIQFWSESIQE